MPLASCTGRSCNANSSASADVSVANCRDHRVGTAALLDRCGAAALRPLWAFRMTTGPLPTTHALDLIRASSGPALCIDAPAQDTLPSTRTMHNSLESTAFARPACENEDTTPHCSPFSVSSTPAHRLARNVINPRQIVSALHLAETPLQPATLKIGAIQGQQ